MVYPVSKRLTISNTPLVNLPQGVFDPLTALSWLSLRDNSELVSLPPRTLRGQHKPREIDTGTRIRS